MAFLAVFGPIYERYQESLDGSEEIDFHDMINRATELVESGRFRSPFKYILVDEFQDISPSRAALLKALLDNCPGAQLFAVGDDWQAIYRFAGSDIAVMQEFGERFGDYERIDLETTFRCWADSSIFDRSSVFVQESGYNDRIQQVCGAFHGRYYLVSARWAPEPSAGTSLAG